MSTRTIAIAIAAFGLSTAAPAQWVTERTSNIPRLADGKPNLAAPAPRTAEGKPDFSGIWIALPDPAYLMNIAADLPPSDVQPWAEQQATQRMRDYGKDDPAAIGCQPFGPRHIFGTMLNEASRTKIVQTRELVVILHEDLAYRQIFMDGRKLPKVTNPAFMGFSVGRWEGEELVVESEGFNEASWLDFGGHPHSDALHITERYRRVDFGRIQRRITLTDPKVFSKPITISSDLSLAPDTELLEYVCAETPRGRSELSGPAEAVHVAPEILAKYVGEYDFEGVNPFRYRTMTVTLVDGQLFADFNGKGHVLMAPISDTMFSPRILGTFEFVMDASGAVTHVMAHSIAASFKIVRRRDLQP
ncbi:MAG TPA: hypothetical protein VJ299_09810 [Steroidobacteraceae bacterium]|jgi:hypothetical protein|nr:hypothetical protein [Steroidobacteraceae bacterium]